MCRRAQGYWQGLADMRYRFLFRNTVRNLLALTLYKTYHSYLGIINMTFAAATGALALSSPAGRHPLIRILAVLAALYFPLFQPIILAIRLKLQLRKLWGEVELLVSERNLYLKHRGEKQEYNWSQIKGVEKGPWQLILYLDAKRGIVIPDRALKGKKEEFYRFSLQAMQYARKRRR